MESGFKEAPKKVSAKKGDKMLKARIADLEADQTFQWYLNQGFQNLSVQYNQLADDVMLKQLHMHLCILEKSNDPLWPKTKSYSKNYAKLPGDAKGFYPSTYTIQKKIDIDGNTEPVEIVDMNVLNEAHKLKTGNDFWFCNVKYKVTLVTLKDSGVPEHGWELRAESKEHKEAIHVRSTHKVYIILNYAMEGNTERQVYGSGRSVSSTIGQKLIAELLMNADHDNGEYIDDHADAQTTQW